MTTEQIEQWKRLVDMAKWGKSQDKRTVIAELDLLIAIEELLKEKVPGWDKNTILPWWANDTSSG